MASIDKHGADTVYFIRHNMRELPPDKAPSNLEIDPKRTKDNFSLISRGKTAEEVNAYRKQLEGEIFHYNRKNLVRSVEVVITLPTDCPPEQEDAFFKEAYNFVVSTLPMGEKCVFLAEVHKDEGRVQKDGVTVIESPPHMHMMYVPSVPDEKHSGYEYKLCADQLTKRAKLKQFHPNFQKWLDDAGIKATVHSGKTGGQNVSVSELKQLTKETGLTLTEIKDLQQYKKVLLTQIKSKERENEQLRNLANQIITDKDHQIEALKSSLSEKDLALSISSQQQQNLQTKIRDLESQIKAKEEELQREREVTAKKAVSRNRTWGDARAWGQVNSWGNKNKQGEVEREW